MKYKLKFWWIPIIIITRKSPLAKAFWLWRLGESSESVFLIFECCSLSDHNSVNLSEIFWVSCVEGYVKVLGCILYLEGTLFSTDCTYFRKLVGLHEFSERVTVLVARFINKDCLLGTRSARSQMYICILIWVQSYRSVIQNYLNLKPGQECKISLYWCFHILRFSIILAAEIFLICWFHL